MTNSISDISSSERSTNRIETFVEGQKNSLKNLKTKRWSFKNICKKELTLIGGDIATGAYIGMTVASFFSKSRGLQVALPVFGFLGAIINFGVGALSLKECVSAFKSGEKLTGWRLLIDGIGMIAISALMIISSLTSIGLLSGVAAFFSANPWFLALAFFIITIPLVCELSVRLAKIIGKKDIFSQFKPIINQLNDLNRDLQQNQNDFNVKTQIQKISDKLIEILHGQFRNLLEENIQQYKKQLLKLNRQKEKFNDPFKLAAINNKITQLTEEITNIVGTIFKEKLEIDNPNLEKLTSAKTGAEFDKALQNLIGNLSEAFSKEQEEDKWNLITKNLNELTEALRNDMGVESTISFLTFIQEIDKLRNAQNPQDLGQVAESGNDLQKNITKYRGSLLLRSLQQLIYIASFPLSLGAQDLISNIIMIGANVIALFMDVFWQFKRNTPDIPLNEENELVDQIVKNPLYKRDINWNEILSNEQKIQILDKELSNEQIVRLLNEALSNEQPSQNNNDASYKNALNHKVNELIRRLRIQYNINLESIAPDITTEEEITAV